MRKRNKLYPTEENLQEEIEINKKVNNAAASSKAAFMSKYIIEPIKSENTKPLQFNH